MLRVFCGCEPGRVSDGSRPALCQTLSLYRMPLVYLFLTWVFCYSCSLSLCRFFFLCVFVFFFCSHWSLVDVPLIFFLSSRPRTGLLLLLLLYRASTIPSNIRGCQSGTWSQRGTKVNGSHHGDNPLLRPTGIQIATKSYATLQAMAPTNSKTVHQTFFTPYRTTCITGYG